MTNTRGAKTYKFTCEQIGELIGVKARTVSTHIKNGVFDPDDLHSLVNYINERSDLLEKPGKAWMIERIEARRAARKEEDTSPWLDKRTFNPPNKGGLFPTKPTPIFEEPEIDICQGEVLGEPGQGEGITYRCEECYLWTAEPPKRAVHTRVLKPEMSCTHPSEKWAMEDGELLCMVCIMAAEMLDPFTENALQSPEGEALLERWNKTVNRALEPWEGICDACSGVVDMNQLHVISTPTLAGVAMCDRCHYGENMNYDDPELAMCEVPPEGWWCSRAPGHKGPCAARPDDGKDCRTCGKKRCLCQLDLF